MSTSILKLRKWKNLGEPQPVIFEDGTGIAVTVSKNTVTISSTSTPAGGTPTGTGLRHVTAGVEDAATKLVENVDVDAAAGIVEAKLALSFATHSNALDHAQGSDFLVMQVFS